MNSKEIGRLEQLIYETEEKLREAKSILRELKHGNSPRPESTVSERTRDYGPRQIVSRKPGGLYRPLSAGVGIEKPSRSRRPKRNWRTR